MNTDMLQFKIWCNDKLKNKTHRQLLNDFFFEKGPEICKTYLRLFYEEFSFDEILDIIDNDCMNVIDLLFLILKEKNHPDIKLLSTYIRLNQKIDRISMDLNCNIGERTWKTEQSINDIKSQIGTIFNEIYKSK